MDILIVKDPGEKRKLIENLDYVFPRGLVRRDNYEEIFDKIDKNAIFIGAYDSSTPIGYAAIYANDVEKKIAYITMIGVATKMQGKRVGRALIKRCFEESKNCGMVAIRLEVLNTNTKAINFYRHHGFEFEKNSTNNSIFFIKKL